MKSTKKHVATTSKKIVIINTKSTETIKIQ